MNSFISKSRNTIVNFTVGDGFLSRCLPRILDDTCLVIAPKPIHQTLRRSTTQHNHVVTLQSLHKLDKSHYKVIVIMCKLPRTTSKSHKHLMSMVKGLQLYIVAHPSDIGSVCSLSELISVTKNPVTKEFKYTDFMFNRYGNGPATSAQARY